MSHHRLVDSRTWTCFEILLIAVGLLAFVSGTIFLSNLSLAPWNPDHERNLAMAYATATAEVQAAQPDCGRQVMKPGDTCIYENCWNKDLTNCTSNNLSPPESYEDRLPQAQAMAWLQSNKTWNNASGGRR